MTEPSYWLYEKCLKIATDAHRGQKRWNGDDYITHPLAVASRIEDEQLKCVAILHDVIEDTKITANDLWEMGVPNDIIKVVEVLTRAKNESYVDYISRVSTSERASAVKIEDLKHNISDLNKGSRRDKYELALIILSVSFSMSLGVRQ